MKKLLILATLWLVGASSHAGQSCATWLKILQKSSILHLSKNINAEGTKPGTVIASPSRSAPDYYYHWVRDAGLAMRSWLDLYHSDLSLQDKKKIKNDLYAYWRLTLFHQSQNSLAGLGEVKFYANGLPYKEPWGRPQNDGPAIRALSLIQWRNFLKSQNSDLAMNPLLYSADSHTPSAIKKDLEYISHHWRDHDFDLWEEVKGHHFFTRLFQANALWEGAKLAGEYKDYGARDWYKNQYHSIVKSLDEFWDDQKGYIRSTINQVGGLPGKSGLDSSIIIAVLENDNVGAGFKEWTVLDSRVQSTAHKLETTFSEIYRINEPLSNLKDPLIKGPMIGRYPEDTYDGVKTGSVGNPWFLNTHYFAEFYFKLALALSKQETLEIDAVSEVFWQPLIGDLRKQDLRRGHDSWNTLLNRLVQKGDSFLLHAKDYVGPFGTMAEQVDRNTGAQLGARDLSWSYSSLLRALKAKEDLQKHLK